MQVVKRDGSLQEFDQEKIARVVAAAGLSPDQSQTLAGMVARRVNESGKSQISTLEIRDNVVEELHKVNPSTANLFVWYEGTKDR